MPIYRLDLTTDLDVAVWFALGEDESPRSSEPGSRPVVYLIATEAHLLPQIDQIDNLGYEALRARRQQAILHFGGWGLHSNICAEQVIAIAELGLDFCPRPGLTKDYLFPGPDEDIFLRDLLTLKDRAYERGVTRGYSYIK